MKISEQTPEEAIKYIQKQILETIKPSLEKGNITFKRSLMYRRQPHKPGEIWYLINFQEGDVLFYKGAYSLNLDFERKLIAEKKLNDFLLAQLAKEMAVVTN